MTSFDDSGLERLPAEEAPMGDVSDAAMRRLLQDAVSLFAEAPAPAVQAAHLEAMVEMAVAAARSAESSPQPVILKARREPVLAGRRLAMGLLGPTVAAPLCVVTLALAGVNIPGPVQAPFDAAGITLPNQSPAGGLRTVVAGVPAAGPKDHTSGHRAHHGSAHQASAKHEGGAHGKGASSHHAHAGAHGSGSAGGAHTARLTATPQPSHSVAAVETPPASPGAGSAPQVEAPSQPSLQAPPAPGSSPHPATGGGGHPSPPPVSVPPSVAGAGAGVGVRPGKGCGDTNHVHLRADECN